MAIPGDFENFVSDLKESLQSKTEDVHRLKEEVREDLDQFKKEFSEQSKNIRKDLKEDTVRRQNDVKALLKQYQVELSEVRSDIRTMHKIWINRKSP